MATDKISNRPWGQISEKDYETAGAFCRACLIDLNPGDDKVKSLCKLPVYEPDGTLNRNAVHAAAAALAGARGGVDAPPEAKKQAAKRLLRLYEQLGETPPDSIVRLAK